MYKRAVYFCFIATTFFRTLAALLLLLGKTTATKTHIFMHFKRDMQIKSNIIEVKKTAYTEELDFLENALGYMCTST